MSSQKMAIVRGKGTLDKVFTQLMPTLYGSVFALKFDLENIRITSLQSKWVTFPLPRSLDETKGRMDAYLWVTHPR
jgi:hypothetical protein